ncbi:MAG: DUF2339 domain-containing protein [Bryobacterales bacterium]|nr:DUF2339 domain-containing protein [Bryobacterales bacterium]
MIGWVALAVAIIALVRLRSLGRDLERLRADVAASRSAPAAFVSAEAPTLAREQRAAGQRGRPGPPAHRSRRAGLRSRLKRVVKLRDVRAGTEKAAGRAGWMVWLGGVSVALGGVFLVKYSIDQGLLTPWARVATGVLAGSGMHALAEVLFRKTGHRHPAFSALAASGTVTLSATALAALHLYDLIPPVAAFAFLALVSMGTVALALRHGPVLAALGLVGSYAVPLLVGGDGGRIVGVLAYSLIVSVAILLLIRRRYRAWLWIGMLGGATLWWLISLASPEADGYRAPYLALLAAVMLVLPFGGAGTRPGRSSVSKRQARGGRLAFLRMSGPAAAPVAFSLVILVLAHGISLLNEPFSLLSAAGWTPLAAIILLAGHWNPRCAPVAWASLAVQAAACIGIGLEVRTFEMRWASPSPELQAGFPVFAAWTAAAYFAFSAWNLRVRRPAALWAGLAAAAPPIWLGVAYLVASDRTPSGEWAGAGVAIGLLFTGLGWGFLRREFEAAAEWAIVGCSGAYSVTAAILLREAGLSVALACQIVPLAWLAVRNRAKVVAWMAKGVLSLTVVRLTFNPWLPAYEQATAWTWWTYGGSALACLLAGRVARGLPALRRWIEVTAVHLIALGLWFASREALYGGEMFVQGYRLPEAAINTAAWAALGLVYLWRARASARIGDVYRWVSRTLLTMSLANYAFVLAVLNPFWGAESVGATKVWNVLLLAYGAPVLLAILAVRFGERKWARVAGLTSGIAAFSFVTIEIRHLWQGAVAWDLPASDAEMVTYSVAWLGMAVGAVLAGGLRFGPTVYRMGMALLVTTICKVFLVDMSGLTGLLRAGSFLGLGLSLLGLAYLNRRLRALRPGPETDEPGKTPDRPAAKAETGQFP